MCIIQYIMLGSIIAKTSPNFNRLQTHQQQQQYSPSTHHTSSPQNVSAIQSSGQQQNGLYHQNGQQQYDLIRRAASSRKLGIMLLIGVAVMGLCLWFNYYDFSANYFNTTKSGGTQHFTKRQQYIDNIQAQSESVNVLHKQPKQIPTQTNKQPTLTNKQSTLTNKQPIQPQIHQNTNTDKQAQHHQPVNESPTMQAIKSRLSPIQKQRYLPPTDEQAYTFNQPKQITLTKSQQQLQDIIHSMQNPPHRPSTIRSVNKSLRLQDEVYFAFSLSKQPNNKDYLQAEYYYFDKKYSIGKSMQQAPICAIIVGRNLGDGYHRMMNSIVRQNYSNYKIVFVDDSSDDATHTNIQNYLNQYPQLKDKTKYIHQSQRKYALFNRNLAIRQYCSQNDIVLDLDADDWLIGRQVFKVINSLYSDQQLWVVYFNNIIYSQLCRCPLMNSDTQVPQEVLENGTYRTGKIWRSTQLRTFRKKLYEKIDEKDFIDKETGQYYKWKSDAFMNFPLVELAGPKHVKFLDEFFYFYDTSFSEPSPGKAYSRISAKLQTPYKPLNTLTDQPQKLQRYNPPQQLIQMLQQQKTKMH